MTLQADNFKVTALRLVAFTPNTAEFDPSALLGAVLGKYAKRFDGDVQSYPIHGEAPPQLPRIQLTSSDEQWALIASLLNITSAWSHKSDEDTASIDEIVARCREPLEHHIHENTIQVGRVSYVISRSCSVENPSQMLVDRFCGDDVKDPKSNEAPLRHSRNFEIHNHKRYSFSQPVVHVNSWVRCKTKTDAGGTSAVTTEQDINTLSEDIETRKFTLTEISQFFDTCICEANSILEKYFPNQR